MIANTTLPENRVRVKINSIRLAGKVAFEKGEVKLFEGFPCSLRFRVNVSVLMRNNNEFDLLMKTIRDAAKSEGLSPFTANIDYPAHCTLLEAECGEECWKKLARLWEEISIILAANNGFLQIGDSLEFSELVVNSSGDVLLMATEVPDNIKSLRRMIADAYANFKLEPRSIEDIMHMTLQRIHKTNASTPDVLRGYSKRIENIAIGTTHIVVEEMFWGSVFQLFE